MADVPYSNATSGAAAREEIIPFLRRVFRRADDNVQQKEAAE